MLCINAVDMRRFMDTVCMYCDAYSSLKSSYDYCVSLIGEKTSSSNIDVRKIASMSMNKTLSAVLLFYKKIGYYPKVEHGLFVGDYDFVSTWLIFVTGMITNNVEHVVNCELNKIVK